MDNCLDTGYDHKIYNNFHKDKQDLEKLNAKLEKEGIKMFYMEGDVATNALGKPSK